MILLVKLILVHLAGDFLLQPASWVKAKEKRKLKAYQLYLHGLVHLVLIQVLVWEWAFLPATFLLVVLHLGIDVIKLFLQKKENKRLLFFVDQGAHIISIYLVYCWYSGNAVLNPAWLNQSNLLLLTMVVFLTRPCSFIIKVFIARWAPHTRGNNNESLEDAGKIIGIFERLFVFVLVITGHWDGVGFLLAAKSVFRFGDLRESKDRRLTEYVLIGTLVSFGIATLTGMAYTLWLQNL